MEILKRTLQDFKKVWDNLFDCSVTILACVFRRINNITFRCPSIKYNSHQNKEVIKLNRPQKMIRNEVVLIAWNKKETNRFRYGAGKSLFMRGWMLVMARWNLNCNGWNSDELERRFWIKLEIDILSSLLLLTLLHGCNIICS